MKTYNFIKKKLRHWSSPVQFFKLLRAYFLQNTPERQYVPVTESFFSKPLTALLQMLKKRKKLSLTQTHTHTHTHTHSHTHTHTKLHLVLTCVSAVLENSYSKNHLCWRFCCSEIVVCMSNSNVIMKNLQLAFSWKCPIRQQLLFKTLRLLQVSPEIMKMLSLFDFF